jgi:hypothetical protein
MFKKKLQQPDFTVAENNAFTAVYVVNPQILECDDLMQRGKPFLFYQGTTFSKLRQTLLEPTLGVRIYAGTNVDLEELLKGRHEAGQQGVAKMSETVMVNGELIEGKKLCSGYVPFSFGVFHDDDIARYQKQPGCNVRLDFQEFKNRVLPRYDARMREEATLGYKLRHLFG